MLAALEAKRPVPVATWDIERVLEQGGDAPVYGPNLRAPCLLLWRADGTIIKLEGDALQVASGYQAAYDAGLPVQIQVNDGRIRAKE